MKNYIAPSCIALCLFLAATQSRASVGCTSIPGNLVANCGFETGDFTSWTLSGNDVPGEAGNLYGVEGTDPDGISPHGGADQAFIGDLDSNATTLSQTIATTATDDYTISFWLAQDTAPTTGYGNELLASFGGTSLASLSDVAIEGYTKYSYTVAATSSSSVLDITLGDGLGEFLLDDVSVVQDASAPPVPEPPAWTLMLTGIMGIGLLSRRGLLAAR
jgi:flagellin